jgi:hypothetical protein
VAFLLAGTGLVRGGRREESSLGREGKDQGMEWRGVGGEEDLLGETERDGT